MNTQLNRILCTILLALAAGVYAQAHAADEVKNVIFFLGDGMGPTTATAAYVYKVGEAGYLTMELLKRTARIKTYSNDAQTTDSAPSMLAYMTGVKMDNEVIFMSADTKVGDTTGKGYVSGADSMCPANNGTLVVTSLELAKAAGKSVDTATTTRVTYVTPAATYSHICHRDGENQIAVQGAPGNALYNTVSKDGLDMLLSGGRRHYLLQGMTGGKRTDTTDLAAQFRAANYTYASTGTQLAVVNPVTTNKLLDLFNLDHMNYELDRVRKSADKPSPADMTEKATRVLQRNGRGYLLMAESDHIDHALHDTNAKRVLEDASAFDKVIKCALGTVDLSNTLIVVMADYDHTMTVNGYSRKGNPVLGVPNDIKTGQPQLAADGLPCTTLVFGNGGMTCKATRDNVAAVDTAADDYLQEVDVQFGMPGSGTHGSGDVILPFSGPGSVSLKGTLNSTKVFGVVKTVMGL